jgi:hypothetical protein
VASLAPGILAGTTHGVIRVSHAVRALLAGPGGAATVTELGRGLAFWAARMQPLISPRRLVVSTPGRRSTMYPECGRRTARSLPGWRSCRTSPGGRPLSRL